MFACTKMKFHLGLVLTLFISFAQAANAQPYYRFKADVTIKEKKIDGTFNLTKGTLYYDINARKAVYTISFPQKALIIITDTAYISIINGKRTSSPSMKEFLDFAIFNLCLTNKLDYYGLKNTPYTIFKTGKTDSMIITTWNPPAKLKKMKGKIKVSMVNKRLFGVISYDTKGNTISKQFFEDYIPIKNLLIPSRVVSFFYSGNEKSVQITEFKNIIINENGNDTLYDHALE